jgi:phosphotransferase system  glucose/maltose/N-acetylglucosamine-specific IIC component
MKNIILNILSGIKESWIEIPRSVRFWNLLVIAIVIGVFMTSAEGSVVIFFLGTIATFSIFWEEREIKNNLWIFAMPITWAIILIGLFVFICEFIYKRYITRFNQWMDNKDQKEEVESI